MSNRRKLKPQVKAVLITLAVILGFIILENLIGAVSSLIKNAKVQSEYNKKEEILQQTPEYKKGEEINEFVNEIVGYLSAGNYEEVYNQTDPDYLNALNIDSPEKLKPIIENHFNGIPRSAQLEGYSKLGNKYVCEISIEKEDLLEMVYITVIPRDSDNYYIIIDDINSIEKHDKQYRYVSSEFECDIKYIVKRANEEILVVEAQNKTSQNLVGSLEKTVLVKSSYDECAVKNIEELQNLNFPAGEIVKISLVFPNDKYAQYPDNSLNLNVNFDNGKSLSSKIYMFSVNDY